MWRFILLLLNLSVSYAKIHSLQYVYTATSEISGFPECVIVGMVDDSQIVYYDSNTQKAVPKQDWVNKAADPQYWERNTGNFLGFQQISKVNLNTLKERFNQTGGVHTYQEMYGCEWDDETEEINGFDEDGFDGGDFTTLDYKESRYISSVPQGLRTAEQWNRDGSLQQRKQYLSTICIEWLKKYLQYGKSSLGRTVSPQVSMLQKSSSSPVTCHATGFYPSGVTITWKKNDQEQHEDVKVGELLPNEDGTFQKTSTITVTPDEWKNNKYSCVVEHKGKSVTTNEIMTNEKDSVPIGIIIGAVAAVVLLSVIGVAGYMMYQKKKGFKPVSASDDGSNSSAHTDPHA